MTSHKNNNNNNHGQQRNYDCTYQPLSNNNVYNTSNNNNASGAGGDRSSGLIASSIDNFCMFMKEMRLMPTKWPTETPATLEEEAPSLGDIYPSTLVCSESPRLHITSGIDDCQQQHLLDDQAWMSSHNRCMEDIEYGGRQTVADASGDDAREEADQYFHQSPEDYHLNKVGGKQRRYQMRYRHHQDSSQKEERLRGGFDCVVQQKPTFSPNKSSYKPHSSDQHYFHYYTYYYNTPAHQKQVKLVQQIQKPIMNIEIESTKVRGSGRKLPAPRILLPLGRADVHDERSHTHKVLKERVTNNNIIANWLVHNHDTQYVQVGEQPVTITSKFQHNDNDSKSKTRAPTNVTDAGLDNESDYPPVVSSLATQSPRKLDMKAKEEIPSTKRSITSASKRPNTHRVLLYNTQSPRLTTRAASMSRVQQQQSMSKAKREAGGHDLGATAMGQHQQSLFQMDYSAKLGPESNLMLMQKLHYDATKRLNARNDNAGFQVPNIDKIKTTNRNGADVSSDEDDYDDDDLDNVSQFDDNVSEPESEDDYRLYAFKLTHSPVDTDSTQSWVSCEPSSSSLSNPEQLLVPSLFPNVPPYLAFSSHNSRGPAVPAELHRILKWRVNRMMPKVVRSILHNSGMRLLKKTDDWMGVWGKHMKSQCFRRIRSYQKFNHLPGSFRIGRKDSCWRNLSRQSKKHGRREFGFMPKTYIMPGDLNLLRTHWPKHAHRCKWIIKPPASARGAGIRVVNRWSQIPKRKPLIVQRYIERPLLINGSKFDLRLYVLVTSLNPLRVFMYKDGLARFASVKYSGKTDTLNDRCMHLTNYSINKFSSNYAKNEDVNACNGHKWTIKSLWSYLATRNIRTDLLWDALRGLVLRTILAGESAINNIVRQNVESKYSCFELFGFDVILDADLIPWLLEVNISPSLHSDLPLDAHVKAPLVQAVLNTALYNVPPKLLPERQERIAEAMKLPSPHICFDKRMYINYLSPTEKIKHSTFTRKTIEDRQEYLDKILENLTPDDVRCLIVAEDELARSSPLERIFPTAQTYKLLRFTESPRYYNRLLDAWENRYGQNRSEGHAFLRSYCERGYHLEVPPPTAKKQHDYRYPTPITPRRLKEITRTVLGKRMTIQPSRRRNLRPLYEQNLNYNGNFNEATVTAPPAESPAQDSHGNAVLVDILSNESAVESGDKDDNDDDDGVVNAEEVLVVKINDFAKEKAMQ